MAKDQQKRQVENADVISSLYWKVGYAQHIGSRKQQQDSVGVVLGTFREKPVLLAILADGMGGMTNGAEFSRIAVDSHRENFQKTLDAAPDPATVLLRLALQANKDANQIFDEEKPGGTTLVTALFVDDRVYTLSVGDSRICLFRQNQRLGRFVPLQLNREHVLGASLDERAWMGQIAFEDAEDNMYRDSLTSAIGDRKIRKIDLPDTPIRFIGGDRLVLMSDGIYRAVSEMELAAKIDAVPNVAADVIVELVLKKQVPQQDNMSVVIVERI